MRNVLADLALESEAATALIMRVAGAFDRSAGDPREAALARLLTPIAKYWICKRAPAVVVEALECLGGNGYVEESILARLYREAPVNSVWEGSGNVICLDVLRAVAREPDALGVLLAESRLEPGWGRPARSGDRPAGAGLGGHGGGGASRPPSGRAVGPGYERGALAAARAADGGKRLVRRPSGRGGGAPVRDPAARPRSHRDLRARATQDRLACLAIRRSGRKLCLPDQPAASA